MSKCFIPKILLKNPDKYEWAKERQKQGYSNETERTFAY